MAGETEVLGENLPDATLSTTNPTWPDPGLNPGRRGRKPATNRFSYGAAELSVPSPWAKIFSSVRPGQEWWSYASTPTVFMAWCLINEAQEQLNLRSIYGCTALVNLGRFFSFLIYTQSVGLLGRGISPLQGLYLHTEQHKHRINAHRHPCFELDSNPWSQCLSQRRRFMP
jgi:hypothetical protein